MVKQFRQAFLDALERENVSVAEIARRSGVSKEQLNKLRQREGSRTNVDDAWKIADAFGLSLDQFLDDRSAQERSEIVELLKSLEPEERAILLRAARGVAAPPRSQAG